MFPRRIESTSCNHDRNSTVVAQRVWKKRNGENVNFSAAIARRFTSDRDEIWLIESDIIPLGNVCRYGKKKSRCKTIHTHRRRVGRRGGAKSPGDFQSLTLLTCPRQLAWPDKFFLTVTVRFWSGHTFRTKYIRIQARVHPRPYTYVHVHVHVRTYNRGGNIWRFTYLFQHNEFHAWSAANHAKVITGTQITGSSPPVKMNVSAVLATQTAHGIDDPTGSHVAQPM